MARFHEYNVYQASNHKALLRAVSEDFYHFIEYRSVEIDRHSTFLECIGEYNDTLSLQYYQAKARTFVNMIGEAKWFIVDTYDPTINKSDWDVFDGQIPAVFVCIRIALLDLSNQKWEDNEPLYDNEGYFEWKWFEEDGLDFFKVLCEDVQNVLSGFGRFIKPLTYDSGFKQGKPKLPPNSQVVDCVRKSLAEWIPYYGPQMTLMEMMESVSEGKASFLEHMLYATCRDAGFCKEHTVDFPTNVVGWEIVVGRTIIVTPQILGLNNVLVTQPGAMENVRRIFRPILGGCVRYTNADLHYHLNYAMQNKLWTKAAWFIYVALCRATDNSHDELHELPDLDFFPRCEYSTVADASGAIWVKFEMKEWSVEQQQKMVAHVSEKSRLAIPDALQVLAHEVDAEGVKIQWHKSRVPGSTSKHVYNSAYEKRSKSTSSRRSRWVGTINRGVPSGINAVLFWVVFWTNLCPVECTNIPHLLAGIVTYALNISGAFFASIWSVCWNWYEFGTYVNEGALGMYSPPVPMLSLFHLLIIGLIGFGSCKFVLGNQISFLMCMMWTLFLGVTSLFGKDKIGFAAAFIAAAGCMAISLIVIAIHNFSKGYDNLKKWLGWGSKEPFPAKKNGVNGKMVWTYDCDTRKYGWEFVPNLPYVVTTSKEGKITDEGPVQDAKCPKFQLRAKSSFKKHVDGVEKTVNTEFWVVKLRQKAQHSLFLAPFHCGVDSVTIEGQKVVSWLGIPYLDVMFVIAEGHCGAPCVKLSRQSSGECFVHGCENKTWPGSFRTERSYHGDFIFHNATTDMGECGAAVVDSLGRAVGFHLRYLNFTSPDGVVVKENAGLGVTTVRALMDLLFNENIENCPPLPKIVKEGAFHDTYQGTFAVWMDRWAEEFVSNQDLILNGWVPKVVYDNQSKTVNWYIPEEELYAKDPKGWEAQAFKKFGMRHLSPIDAFELKLIDRNNDSSGEWERVDIEETLNRYQVMKQAIDSFAETSGRHNWGLRQTMIADLFRNPSKRPPGGNYTDKIPDKAEIKEFVVGKALQGQAVSTHPYDKAAVATILPQVTQDVDVIQGRIQQKAKAVEAVVSSKAARKPAGLTQKEIEQRAEQKRKVGDQGKKAQRAAKREEINAWFNDSRWNKEDGNVSESRVLKELQEKVNRLLDEQDSSEDEEGETEETEVEVVAKTEVEEPQKASAPPVVKKTTENVYKDPVKSVFPKVELESKLNSIIKESYSTQPAEVKKEVNEIEKQEMAKLFAEHPSISKGFLTLGPNQAKSKQKYQDHSNDPSYKGELGWPKWTSQAVEDACLKYCDLHVERMGMFPNPKKHSKKTWEKISEPFLKKNEKGGSLIHFKSIKTVKEFKDRFKKWVVGPSFTKFTRGSAGWDSGVADKGEFVGRKVVNGVVTLDPVRYAFIEKQFATLYQILTGEDKTTKLDCKYYVGGKDEPTKESKLEQGMPRVIYNVDPLFNILGAFLFDDLTCSHVVEYCPSGKDMTHAAFAKVLHDRFISKDEKKEMDVDKSDTSYGPVHVESISDWLGILYKGRGCGPNGINIQQKLWEMTVKRNHPQVRVLLVMPTGRCFVINWAGYLPSGLWITTLVNSYLYVATCMEIGVKDRMVLGDDLEVLDPRTFEQLAEEFKKYGHTATKGKNFCSMRLVDLRQCVLDGWDPMQFVSKKMCEENGIKIDGEIPKDGVHVPICSWLTGFTECTQEEIDEMHETKYYPTKTRAVYLGVNTNPKKCAMRLVAMRDGVDEALTSLARVYAPAPWELWNEVEKLAPELAARLQSSFYNLCGGNLVSRVLGRMVEYDELSFIEDDERLDG